MESNEKKFPSYFVDYFTAHPDKFEKRANELKPKIFYSIAIIAVVLVIFPNIIPLAGWIVRTIGVIIAIVFAIAGHMSSFDIINIKTGGKITTLGYKKI